MSILVVLKSKDQSLAIGQSEDRVLKPLPNLDPLQAKRRIVLRHVEQGNRLPYNLQPRAARKIYAYAENCTWSIQGQSIA
jgi:hypothetical protein